MANDNPSGTHIFDHCDTETELLDTCYVQIVFFKYCPPVFLSMNISPSNTSTIMINKQIVALWERRLVFIAILKTVFATYYQSALTKKEKY